MSLTVIKAGVLDTIQDLGRYGFQHLGINTGGAMDPFAAALANCLLGKRMEAPVIEFHFPASKIRFNEPTIFTITGADFSPVLDHKKIPLCKPMVARQNAVLEFQRLKKGCRCYLSTFHDFNLLPWLGSFSTNIKAGAGGLDGRALLKDDVILLKKNSGMADLLSSRNGMTLPWFAKPASSSQTGKIGFIKGKEWKWLSEESRRAFTDGSFAISQWSDRMGYRLHGPCLNVKSRKNIVSSGVTFGTIQLLPNKQLIILMADHQTTGGYPVIGNIITPHLPRLAQMRQNEEISFAIINGRAAEKQCSVDNRYLLSIQYAASSNIKKLLQ